MSIWKEWWCIISGHFIPSFNYLKKKKFTLNITANNNNFRNIQYPCCWLSYTLGRLCYSISNISVATETWKHYLYVMHCENNWICYKMLVTQLVGQHIYTCCSFVFDTFNEIRYETIAFIQSASVTYYLLLDSSCWGVQQNTWLVSKVR